MVIVPTLIATKLDRQRFPTPEKWEFQGNKASILGIYFPTPFAQCK